MNKKFIIYNLQEAEEEIANMMNQLRKNNHYTHEEFYRSMQHLIHHVNIAWNGRNATDEPTEIEVNQWGQTPTDIKLI